MDTNTVIPNKTNTQLNNYKGGAFQQSISAVSNTDQICYEQDAKCYSTYGFEYKPGFDGSVRMLVQVSSSVQTLTRRLQYITWMASGVVTWTLKGDALGPDPTSQISARPVPFEPMVRTLTAHRRAARSRAVSVRDCEPRLVSVVRRDGPRDAHLPGAHADRLHSRVSAEGRGQRRLRPHGRADAGLHQSVRCSISICLAAADTRSAQIHGSLHEPEPHHMGGRLQANDPEEQVGLSSLLLL
jgi:hypothetical protein